VVCLGPRGPAEIVGPRPLSGVVGRPLNFTVRLAGKSSVRTRQGIRPDNPSLSPLATLSHDQVRVGIAAPAWRMRKCASVLSSEAF